MEHLRYCAKSSLRCLVYHPDGVCPHVRDCEACKQEKAINFPPSGKDMYASGNVPKLNFEELNQKEV